MSYYHNDKSSEKPLEFKLKGYEFKLDPGPLKVRWTRLTEPDLEHIARTLRKMEEGVSYTLDQAMQQQRFDDFLRVADDREAAYRRKIDLFMEQTEKRK